MDPFPLFVGCSRSGTTLVRAMFDSHSQLAIPGESHFVVTFAQQRGLYELPSGFAAGPFLDSLLRRPRFLRWELPEQEVRDAFAATPAGHLADAFRLLFSLYAHREGKPRYGDKTPGYGRQIPLLAELFPEARFVHVIRDGRDVALSLVEMEWAPGGLRAATLRWKEAIELGRAAGAALGPARYYELRYEELVADPGSVLRPLCDFLDLDFEARMLRYYERAGALIAPFVDRESHRHLYLPPTRGLRDWRRQMTPGDLAVFEDLAGETLDALGYEL